MFKRIISVFVCFLLTVCLFGCDNNSSVAVSSGDSLSRPSSVAIEPFIQSMTTIGAVYLGADGKMWGISLKSNHQTMTEQQISLMPDEVVEAINNGHYNGTYLQPALFSDSTPYYRLEFFNYGIDSGGRLFRTQENSATGEESFSQNIEYLANGALEHFDRGPFGMALLNNGDVLVTNGPEIDGSEEYTALNGEKLRVLHADAVAFGDGWYLDSKGDLYVMAYNNGHGTRGNGEFDAVTVVEISSQYTGDFQTYVSPDGYKFYSYSKVMSGVKKAYGHGATNMFAIKDDDSLWAWGENDLGLVGDGGDGDGDISTRCVTATPVKILDNVREMALADYTFAAPITEPLYYGYDTAFALTYSGELYGWGNNTCGAIGNGSFSEDGSTLIVNRPEKIMENVKKVYEARSCVFVLDENDNLYSWGYSYLGNTGTGLRAPGYDSGALVPPAELNSDYFVHKPTFVFSNVVAVFVYRSLGSYAVNKSGELYGWGNDPFGLCIDRKKETDGLEIFAEPCIHPFMKARIDEQGISFEPVQ